MKTLFSYLIMKYKNSSLKSKLFLSYFILIFIPILIMSFFSTQKSAEVVKNQSVDIAKLYLTQTKDVLTSEIQKMASVSQMVAQQADIRKILEKKDQNISFSEEYDDMYELYQAITSVRSMYNVYRIKIYISDNFRYSKSNYITYSMNAIEDTAWYQDMVKNYKFQTILAPYEFRPALSETESLISVVTIIRSFKDINDILGIVSVDILEEDLIKLMKTGDFTEDGDVFIVNKNQDVICHYGNGTSSIAEQYVPILNKMISQESETVSMQIEGTAAVGLSTPIFDDWRIFTVASFKKLLASSNNLTAQLLVLSIIVAIIVYFLAYFYSEYNNKRIKILAEQIKQLEKGNLNVKCIVDSEDEIGELQHSFNFMVRKINMLLSERYNLGKNLKGMELKALQAQINPHFLYNTLDLISWKAKKNNSPEIVDIVFKLARFYQISLSNGSDFIPLKNEIEHIHFFIDLQNLRFNQTILLRTDIDQEIEDYPIMKLILQPIAENSIAHGIMNMDNKQGIIDISAKRSGKYIEIIVTDNGIGIE
ncbi:MAG: histidine kinase, partial [Oscillospiraceae bacterium]